MRPKLYGAQGDGVVLLDGGLGTLLFTMGLDSGRAPEWWNLEHPLRVTAAHRAYVEAGSDIVHTNSFGGSPLKLETVGLGGRCQQVNRAAVEAAKAACGDEAWVAGDIGPTGKMFPPMGDATEETLAEAFREQTEALAEAGADLLSIETMYDLREAKAAVAAAVATGLPVFASMTFEPKRRGTFTLVGDRIGPSLTALGEAGATAVGFNCSVEPSAMLPMVREARETIEGAPVIVAQPNAGQPRVTPAGIVYDAEPQDFAASLVAMIKAGARIVGGCCGTDPDFIRAARAKVDAINDGGANPGDNA